MVGQAGKQEPGLIIHSYLGVLNGVLSSITAIGVLPYLESLFDNIRHPPLELSNPNHPLLRRMMVEAPGTYHLAFSWEPRGGCRGGNRC